MFSKGKSLIYWDHTPYGYYIRQLLAINSSENVLNRITINNVDIDNHLYISYLESHSLWESYILFLQKKDPIIIVLIEIMNIDGNAISSLIVLDLYTSDFW